VFHFCWQRCTESRRMCRRMNRIRKNVEILWKHAFTWSLSTTKNPIWWFFLMLWNLKIYLFFRSEEQKEGVFRKKGPGLIGAAGGDPPLCADSGLRRANIGLFSCFDKENSMFLWTYRNIAYVRLWWVYVYRVFSMETHRNRPLEE